MDSIKEVFNKSDVLFQKENYSKSKDVYLSILDITKDKYDLIKCYTQLGECYFHENDFDNAKKYYEMSFELEPVADNILRFINICFISKDLDNVYKYTTFLIETIKNLEKKYNNYSSFISYYEEAINILEYLSDSFNYKEAKEYLNGLSKQNKL